MVYIDTDVLWFAYIEMGVQCDDQLCLQFFTLNMSFQWLPFCTLLIKKKNPYFKGNLQFLYSTT